MPYVTQQDLIDRFSEEELLTVADRDGDGVVDAAVVTAALADTDAMIDSYIAKAYDLPLASTPAALAAVAAAIARYKLHKDAADDRIKDDFDDALKFLQDVAKGLVELDIGGVEPAASPSGIATDAQDRIFDRTTLKGF